LHPSPYDAEIGKSKSLDPNKDVPNCGTPEGDENDHL
jgi:hypothetical protein